MPDSVERISATAWKLLFEFSEYYNHYSKMIKNALFIALFILCGCATGSKIITGNARPQILPDNVKIFATMPQNAETIAILTAENSSLYKQPGMNSCLKKLKSEAAKIGANGLVISSQFQSGFTGTSLSGTAIFLPQ